MRVVSAWLFCAGSLLAGEALAQQCEHPIADLLKCKERTKWGPHTPKVSAPPCGPEGSRIAFLFPQSCGRADYKPACSAHDICYDTCNSSKGTCDMTFRTQLEASCVMAYPYPTSGVDEEWDRRGTCFSRGDKYAKAVTGSDGQTAYDDAQKVTVQG